MVGFDDAVLTGLIVGWWNWPKEADCLQDGHPFYPWRWE